MEEKLKNLKNDLNNIQNNDKKVLSDIIDSENYKKSQIDGLSNYLFKSIITVMGSSVLTYLLPEDILNLYYKYI